MSRFKTPSVGLAAALAGIYLVLALFSMACAVDHADPMPVGHHHGGTVSHSSFCVWACQANPVALVVERDHTVIAGGAGFHAASRAPPVQS